MITEHFAYGARRGQRLTVAPGETKTLTLDSTYVTPFILATENKSTTGAAASAFRAAVQQQRPAGAGAREAIPSRQPHLGRPLQCEPAVADQEVADVCSMGGLGRGSLRRLRGRQLDRGARHGLFGQRAVARDLLFSTTWR